jgi:hypothetical protein
MIPKPQTNIIVESLDEYEYESEDEKVFQMLMKQAN